MTSTIFTPMPYFYIIRHNPTGMLYAGAKWGKDANPNNFMKPGGYTTSSLREGGVNDLISKDGLDSFEIIDIILEEEIQVPFGCQTIYEYETWFLKSNSIAQRANWLNRHNNTCGYMYGSDEFKMSMLSTYGVENPMFSDKIKQKQRKTTFNNNGVNYILEDNNIKRNGMMKKYGEFHPMHVKEIVDKKNLTNIDKYGNICSLRGQEQIKKTLVTFEEKYGENITNCMQAESVIKKHQQSIQETYGSQYTNPSQVPEVRDKINKKLDLLNNRCEVKKIDNFLKQNKSIAKVFGLHHKWRYSNDQYLKDFCLRYNI